MVLHFLPYDELRRFVISIEHICCLTADLQLLIVLLEEH
jgi:hypothetical protein